MIMQLKYLLPCGIIFLVSFQELRSSRSVEKRLLLSDPNHLQQEIDALTSRLQALENDNAAHKTQIKQMESQMSTKGKGDIFIHWGKETCNTVSSTLVYSGFAAGSGYGDSGSSSKTLCLPPDPIFSSSGPQDLNPGHIYGTEYEMTQLEGMHPQNQDVPCAVCMSHPGTKILMIPARNKCYDGWTKIYDGFLVGNRYTNPASIDHVCLDKTPSFILGGGADDNGRIFHLQKSRCGSLKCPPYENDKFVTCVVCGFV